ncbi:hypothetical protein Pfo_022144 [Paulownia fortunei]|nr:hypothetical protein Pfo_022144 [Paulownia fortunei]
MASPGPSEQGKKECISLRVLRSVLMGRSSLIPCPSLAHLCYWELGGPKCRSGGLSITLGGPGGRVIGGCTGCLSISALPMQIGTWIVVHCISTRVDCRLDGQMWNWNKRMANSQNGSRAIYVLSASVAISNGRFDILSVSGSFMLSEVAGQKSRTGGLSISLAGPDGRVLGDCVAGLLAAASPVQVKVGSFLPDGHKEAETNYMEPSSASPKVYLSVVMGKLHFFLFFHLFDFTVDLQEQFDILSLSGSLMLLVVGGQKCRFGGLGITLGGPGWRIISGCAGCLLISALPMQDDRSSCGPTVIELVCVEFKWTRLAVKGTEQKPYCGQHSLSHFSLSFTCHLSRYLVLDVHMQMVIRALDAAAFKQYDKVIIGSFLLDGETNCDQPSSAGASSSPSRGGCQLHLQVH